MPQSPRNPAVHTPPPKRSYHRELSNVSGIDVPSQVDDARYLFSMPFIGMIDAVADILFPPNTVKSAKGVNHVIAASDAMVHRYILFRATWQPDWGKDVHTALRLFSNVCDKHFGSSFPLLPEAKQIESLSMLEDRKFSNTDWSSVVDQRRAFNQIREAIAEGLFAEPGYGGNLDGLGWYYSNFMVIED